MGLTHRVRRRQATVTPESTSREYDSTSRHPVRRFTVSRPPPFRLSFHLCFRVVPVCVSSFSVWDSLGPVAFGVVPRAKLSAPSSVAWVCRLTPLYTRTTLCRLSLLHHLRRSWVSLTFVLSRGERGDAYSKQHYFILRYSALDRSHTIPNPHT